MIYTVTLNPALDYVVRLPGSLTSGGINRAAEENIVCGGKGINVSAILHTLGMKTMALGFAAGFTGAALESGLTAQGIAHDFVHLEEGMTRINVKIRADDETEINGCGPEIPEQGKEDLFRRLQNLQADDVLILSGSVPPSLPADIYEQILKRTAGKGVRIVVDTAGESLLKTLPYHPFLIKPNRSELGDLFGKAPESEEEILAYARKLQAAGAENVLVSLAGDGAVLLAEDGTVLRQRPAKGSIRNSVGAGDAMVAGFVAGYLKTGDYKEALRLGTAAGSATAFSVGLAEREAILEQYETLQASRG